MNAIVASAASYALTGLVRRDATATTGLIRISVINYRRSATHLGRSAVTMDTNPYDTMGLLPVATAYSRPMTAAIGWTVPNE